MHHTCSANLGGCSSRPLAADFRGVWGGGAPYISIRWTPPPPPPTPEEFGKTCQAPIHHEPGLRYSAVETPRSDHRPPSGDWIKRGFGVSL